MITKLFAWFTSLDGITGIEYSLISGGIALVSGVTAITVGDELIGMFNDHFLGKFETHGIAE